MHSTVAIRMETNDLIGRRYLSIPTGCDPGACVFDVYEEISEDSWIVFVSLLLWFTSLTFFLDILLHV